MTNTDNELDEILTCNCAMNDIINGKHYDDCPKALKQKLIKWQERKAVEARIDQLNQIRLSDTKLNHGTIELMGHMSQELNKQKLALTKTLREDAK